MYKNKSLYNRVHCSHITPYAFSITDNKHLYVPLLRGTFSWYRALFFDLRYYKNIPLLFHIRLAPCPNFNFLNDLIHLPDNFANSQVVAQIRITTNFRLIVNIVHIVFESFISPIYLVNTTRTYWLANFWSNMYTPRPSPTRFRFVT